MKLKMWLGNLNEKLSVVLLRQFEYSSQENEDIVNFLK